MQDRDKTGFTISAQATISVVCPPSLSGVYKADKDTGRASGLDQRLEAMGSRDQVAYVPSPISRSASIDRS